MILAEVKTTWGYKVQDGGHENMEDEYVAVDETQVNPLSDFSWTYQRHCHDGLVALTPNIDGVMGPWWSDRWMEQPNPTRMWSESVMFKSDLLPTKFFSSFLPNFSPVIAAQIIIQPKGWWLHQNHQFALRRLSVLRIWKWIYKAEHGYAWLSQEMKNLWR